MVAADIQEYARVLAEAVLNGDLSWSVQSVERELGSDCRTATLWQALAALIKLEDKVALEATHGDSEPFCKFLEIGNLAGEEIAGQPSGSLLARAMSEARTQLAALSLSGADTVCVRHFGGQYFSYAQAAELDAIANLARNNRNPVLLAAALSTASQLVNSIGKQFAQPIRPRDKFGIPKRQLIKKLIAERGVSAQLVFKGYLRQYNELAVSRRDHIAIRADFRTMLANPPIKPSVIYADPPYTRDHYSRFYHSLETIALGDDPNITRSNLGGGGVQSRGSYRDGRHQSPFCIKSEAPAAFSALFAGVEALRIPLVLSYSGYDPSTEARPRVMTLNAVVDLAKQHFRDVQVERLAGLEHMKLNVKSLNKAGKGTTEILLLCR